MEIEEEPKPTILDNKTENINRKKRYFRVEKTKYNPLENKEKESKKIFKTQKDYQFSKGKIFREFKRINPKKVNNKFITSMNKDSEDKENNSFIVKKIFPKKLKVIKEKKIKSKQFDDFWKSQNNILIDNKNIFSDEQKINFCFNNITEQKAIDELILQIYQSLQILDRKINEFMNFKNLKDNVKVNKEDFNDISSLKENLLLMKNALNNSMSQNLINIYSDIDNFCKIYDRSSVV